MKTLEFMYLVICLRLWGYRGGFSQRNLWDALYQRIENSRVTENLFSLGKIGAGLAWKEAIRVDCIPCVWAKNIRNAYAKLLLQLLQKRYLNGHGYYHNNIYIEETTYEERYNLRHSPTTH